MATNHTVILLHGMGKPDSKMFEDWEKSLAKLHDSYAEPGDEFATQFECVPINYDSFFEDRRNAWAEQVQKILDAGVALPVNDLTVDDLEPITEDNFFTTHLMDVLLYRFDPLVADEIRDHVAERMLHVIRNRPAGTKVSVLAHSLGTSIAHDAINVIYHPPQVHAKPKLTTGNFRFHAIIQLANNSRALESKWSAYNSFVRPGIKDSDGGQYVATRMLSASHKYDPLAALRGFNPIDNWPNAETVKEKRMVLVNPSIIQHWNVHDFSHYLNDPRVHIPMFRFLRTKGFISEARETETYFQFDSENPITKFDDYRRELRTLLTEDDKFSWKGLVEVFKKFATLVKEVTE